MKDEEDTWALRQFFPPDPQAPGKMHLGLGVYALRLATCPVCGYVELFDPEVIKP